jgi:mutual gliding-motility protein MglA
MSMVNPGRPRATIVLFGPDGAGKSTNLGWLHSRLNGIPFHPPAPRAPVPGLSERQSLSFNLEGRQPLTLMLHTTSGGDSDRDVEARRLLLRLVGQEERMGVIFVADSSDSRAEANIMAHEELRMHLVELNQSEVPVIFQWNKRDVPDALPIDELSSLLEAEDAPQIEAVAIEGTGVMETIELAVQSVLRARSRGR